MRRQVYGDGGAQRPARNNHVGRGDAARVNESSVRRSRILVEASLRRRSAVAAETTVVEREHVVAETPQFLEMALYSCDAS